MEISSTKSKKPSKLEEMTKEQIRRAILKKRECNSKAQNIVESLLEKGISENDFLRCLPDINQSHLDDVIEERSIISLCGYPVCKKTLSAKDIPKQKYRISMKTNKVYDITARKHFCSNGCYKSAMYIKKQMLTSPLWFREYDEIPNFHLLPLDTVGSMGQEVDVALVDRINITSVKATFSSIKDFTSASLNEITSTNNGESTDSDIIDSLGKLSVDTNGRPKEASVSAESQSEDQNDNKRNVPHTISSNVRPKSSKTPQSKPQIPNPLNIVGDIIEKAEQIIDPIITHELENKAKANHQPVKKVQKKQPLITTLIIEVEKCLAEWFTVDTMLFLFGEEKVKEMVADKGECIKEYLTNYAKGIFYKSNAYDQYQKLCKKLNMLEWEDRKYDSQTLQREMKPLPDYSMLQAESTKMQLKVKAFFSGATEVPEPIISALPNDNGTNDGENLTQLPLVDKNAQNALRRRIVCQHLNKLLPDLLRSLGVLSMSVISEVNLLVNTFKLKADNIMFKPIQWNLIALVFIKLLSLREKRLEYLLEQPMAFQHMQLLLLSYMQDGGYLDRLILWLTDIDRLLDTNDTQLTVE